MMLSEQALAFARAAHEGQIDEDGVPVIEHPIAVAARLSTEEEKATAYLHDVLEDTTATEQEIREQFGDRIADAVAADTRRTDETYWDYLDRLKENSLALRVKLADLEHNITRNTRLDQTYKIRRLEKHKKAYAILKEYQKQNDMK